MPRPFSGSGFFPISTPPPAAYLALVAIFGSEAAADAWLEGWIAYAGDGATSEDLLAALEAVGVPADAFAVLQAAPVRRSVDLALEYVPVYDLAFAAPATPLADSPARATDLS